MRKRSKSYRPPKKNFATTFQVLFRVRSLQKSLSSPGKVSRLFRGFGSLSGSGRFNSTDGDSEESLRASPKPQGKCHSAMYAFDQKTATAGLINGVPPKTKIKQVFLQKSEYEIC
jgi:hypothetical protein